MNNDERQEIYDQCKLLLNDYIRAGVAELKRGRGRPPKFKQQRFTVSPPDTLQMIALQLNVPLEMVEEAFLQPLEYVKREKRPRGRPPHHVLNPFDGLDPDEQLDAPAMDYDFSPEAIAARMSTHKFPYRWTLKDANFKKDKGKVFSCFACGGGSTMGYKLAGYDVIGCNEIDPRMNDVYVANHHPRINLVQDIRELVESDDLPEELYDLDILDASPPCSSFSICGIRERGWGKEKMFREGQTTQVLDTLFFDAIALVNKLRPKVAIFENVKGILVGNARQYVKRIHKELDKAGYYVVQKLLNSKDMGVPQKRERAFFCCLRKDLAHKISGKKEMPPINLIFLEDEIPFGDVKNYGVNDRPITVRKHQLWLLREYGDVDLSRSCPRNNENPNKFYNCKFLYDDRVSNTITGGDVCIVFDEGRFRNNDELCLCGTFPMDFDFGDEKRCYLIGMSVPPVMMAQVADRVWEYWLSKVN